jgi:hypothetical protein
LQSVTTPTTSGVTLHTVEVDFPSGTHSLGVNAEWGYIFLDNITVTKIMEPLVEPTVSPSTANFVVTQVAPLSFNVNSNDYAFAALSMNGQTLQAPLDYSLNSGTLTLTDGFLSSLAVGTHSLELLFNAPEAADVTKTISISADETPVYQPSVNPTSVTVNVDSVSDVTLNVNSGSFTFSGVTADSIALTNGVDYELANDSLILKSSYLSTLVKDQTVDLAINFVSESNGFPTLNVPLFAVGALTGTCFDYNQLALEGDAHILDSRVKVTGQPGSGAYWQFSVEKAGQYEAVVTYSTEGGDKIASYELNSAGYPNITWPNVSVNSPEEKTFVHSLESGVHTVGVFTRSGDWGWVNLHNLCINFMGSMDIVSPSQFDSLPTGSDISVEFTKDSVGALTYSVNGSALQTYTGTSPLIIPNQGDGLYDLDFGVVGTSLGESVRIQVGELTGTQYVDTLGSLFVYGNAPFYFNGSNQYYLMYKPEAMAEDFFKRAEHLGMTVVRTWMFCNDEKTHDGVCINQQTAAGEFLLTKDNRTSAEQAIVDRSYELFDNYVKLAHDYNQKLVLSLADEWDYFGNIVAYGSNPYTNRSAVDLFKGFITELLSHTNPLTGFKYSEDPAIMMWELANEPRCSSGCDQEIFTAWVKEISEHIKSLAPNHLVSIGAETSFGYNGTGDDLAFTIAVNDMDSIDAVSAHLYPTWWNMTPEQTLGNLINWLK